MGGILGLLRVALIAAAAVFVTRWLRKKLSADRSQAQNRPVWPGARESQSPARGKLKVLQFPSGPHEVLGVEPGASEAEILQAYEAGMAENEPERVSDMGGEIQELAARRQAEIEAAYRELCGEE